MSITQKLKIILLSLFMGNVALAGDYSFTTGAEYTVGDYGSAIDTSALYVPFTLGYNTEQYAWSVTVPYVRISGSEDVIFSSMTRSPMLSKTTTSNVEHTDSGLGDITLTGSYQLQKETKQSAWLAVTASIKLGTADEDKQLGTGENDYSLQLEAAKQALHGYVGYKIVGDSNTVEYDNVIYAAAGIVMPANDDWTAGVEFYTEQAAVSGADDAMEASLSLSKPLSKEKQFSVYLIKGFTDASPDWGVGVTLVHRL
ncbi:MAG: transporter [Thioalkalispiraceae bacterium]|jgi:hypothetical protein